MTDPNDAYLPREAQARIKIDRLLVDAGWLVQHANQANLSAGRGVAVREFILEKGHGRVDYLLFVDGQPTGVIEAKPEGTTLVEVEHQSGKYVTGLLPRWRPGSPPTQVLIPVATARAAPYCPDGVSAHGADSSDAQLRRAWLRDGTARR